ncbi:hypothetical protein H2248_003981 [Termitomyces sp. 'cryptogamus']|nr:hypothetical protein H2248_003981 [Termitomyces sp. 'cryptogamus']
MAFILYNAAFKEHRIEYRNSSAIEVDSRRSLGGSTLMIVGETFLNVTFSGTSILIYGGNIPLHKSDTGPLPDSEKNALIDGVPITVTFAQNSGGLLYKSPEFTEGFHSLDFPNMSNVCIDYMLVTPGNQTEVLGETLLINDNDPSLSYEGDWVRDTPHFLERMPLENSTMRTDSPGASVSFPFTGTAVSAFGYCEEVKDILNVDVYLDGVLAPKTAINSDEARFTIVPLFAISGLSGTTHTLKLQLTNNGINNNSIRTNLSIDHFTYVPSFRSFAIERITNIRTTAPSSEVNFSTPTSPPSTKPSGARLAGLIFGVIGIALFLALLVFRRRIFKRRVRPPPEIPPFALGSHGKDVAVVQRPQQQQQNLLPSTSGRPLRGILKRESESRPLYAVKASPREAKLAITEKAGKSISHHPLHHLRSQYRNETTYSPKHERKLVSASIGCVVSSHMNR